MPRNGSGTYSLVSGNPVSNGTTIQSNWANNTLSDIASALTASIAIDGQTPATNNLPMGGNKHTNVAVASATTDYLRADQEQNSSLQYLTSVFGTNAITASASITPAAYAAGQTFRFVSAGANTTAVTLSVNGLGAKNVTKNGTTALVAGDIPASAVVEVTYDGTQFQLVNIAITRTSLGAAASGANTDITSLNAPALGAATATTAIAGSNGTGVATTAFVQNRAWVNLNGAGSGDLRRGSWNVSSVTDNATGDYTLNFATGMVDTNYATVVTSTTNSGANAGFYGGLYPGGLYSTSQVQVAVFQSAVGFFDATTVCVAVFR